MFVWVLSGFIEMLIENISKNLKNSEKNKIMIWWIHYFITKLKTKINVIPSSCFKCLYIAYGGSGTLHYIRSKNPSLLNRTDTIH